MKTKITMTLSDTINGEVCDRDIVFKADLSKEFAQDFITLASGRWVRVEIEEDKGN